MLDQYVGGIFEKIVLWGWDKYKLCWVTILSKFWKQLQGGWRVERGTSPLENIWESRPF